MQEIRPRLTSADSRLARDSPDWGLVSRGRSAFLSRPMKSEFLPRLLLLAAVAAGPLNAAETARAQPSTAQPPNVVFILADDLGQRDLGVYGSSFYETPHLDALARRGVRFTQAYAAANVCSPTRASLLTGRYPARLGITDWLPGRTPQPTDRLLSPELAPHLGSDTMTFADAFRAAGYRTAFIGKWHLGDGPENAPDRHGFELNRGGSGKGSTPSYFSPYRLPNLADGPPGEYLDERLTRETVSFIRAAHAEGRPFLVELSHYAVHIPLQAKPELIAKYTAKLKSLPAGADFAEGPPDGRVRVRQTNPIYAAMVESLDTSVGAVLAELAALGIADNTIVVFTSDNGGLATSEGWPTSNLPLRGGKGWAYEGGVREPLFVAWPGHLPAGAVTDAIVTSPDLFPTLLELAGLPPQPAAHVDGVSFAATLAQPDRKQPDRAIFWHYPHYSNQRGRPHGAVRRGDWKLIEWFEDGRTELFNLAADPGEAHDLATAEPDRTASLLAELRAWRQQVGARLPRPNTPAAAAR